MRWDESLHNGSPELRLCKTMPDLMIASNTEVAKTVEALVIG